MSDAFLSSDDFDEQAHHLYNEGRYDEALLILKEGITLYPHAVELHIGMAYAHLAREEYAWARRSFEQRPRAGSRPRGRPGRPGRDAAQAGRPRRAPCGPSSGSCSSASRTITSSCCRWVARCSAKGTSRPRTGSSISRPPPIPTRPTPPPASATPRTGWATTRARSTGSAERSSSTRRYSEARIYLANLLYDRGETEAALHQLERTQPEDHFDELGIWRHIELKKTVYRLPDEDPELVPWLTRLGEVAGEPDAIDMLLAEVEAQQADGGVRDPHQLELFGTLLSELHAMQKKPGQAEAHLVVTLAGQPIRGNWEEILLQMKEADRDWATGSLTDFMASLARRGQAETGVVIPTTDAEAFIRGSAEAGVLRIVQ